MTIEQRLYAGDQAKQVLENEAFTSAFDAIEKEVTEQWMSSPSRDQDGRERLWMYLQMLHKLKAQLTSTMETGAMAKLDLQHKQSLYDKARGMLSSVG